MRIWPDMEVRLDAGVTGVDIAPRPVPVSSHIARYHPVVTAFRDRNDRLEISPTHLPCALRLLHALVTEAERRGYTAAVAADPHRSYSWSSTVHGHITITVDGHPTALRICEDGLPARGQFNRSNLPGTPYPTGTGTGLLRLACAGYGGGDGRTSRWADSVRDRLEDKLPAVLREIEIRAAVHVHRAEEAARREAEAQWRRDRAVAEATARYIEAARAEQLAGEVHRRRFVEHARAYLAAVRSTIESRHTAAVDTDEARRWLVWAEQHIATLDPLNGSLTLPTVPAPTPANCDRSWRPTGYRSSSRRGGGRPTTVRTYPLPVATSPPCRTRHIREYRTLLPERPEGSDGEPVAQEDVGRPRR